MSSTSPQPPPSPSARDPLERLQCQVASAPTAQISACTLLMPVCSLVVLATALEAVWTLHVWRFFTPCWSCGVCVSGPLEGRQLHRCRMGGNHVCSAGAGYVQVLCWCTLMSSMHARGPTLLNVCGACLPAIHVCCTAQDPAAQAAIAVTVGAHTPHRLEC
jgi:hypothetical protein